MGDQRHVDGGGDSACLEEFGGFADVFVFFLFFRGGGLGGWGEGEGGRGEVPIIRISGWGFWERAWIYIFRGGGLACGRLFFFLGLRDRIFLAFLFSFLLIAKKTKRNGYKRTPPRSKTHLLKRPFPDLGLRLRLGFRCCGWGTRVGGIEMLVGGDVARWGGKALGGGESGFAVEGGGEGGGEE